MRRGSKNDFGWHWQALRLASVFLLASCCRAQPQPLPGAAALTIEGDIASQMVDGIDRFLMKQIEKAAANRERFWKLDFSSKEAYEKSIAPNRARLAHILGVRDPRPARIEMELVATTEQPAWVGQ